MTHLILGNPIKGSKTRHDMWVMTMGRTTCMLLRPHTMGTLYKEKGAIILVPYE